MAGTLAGPRPAELGQPRRQADRAAGGVEQAVGGDCGRAHVVVSRQQVRHLERRAGDVGEVDVDVELVVEAQRLEVADVGLEHGGVGALFAPLGVRVADVAEVGDSRLLEVRQVAAVVDDLHRVGLGEAHADAVAERIVARVGRRFDADAHRSSVACRPRSGVSRSRQVRAMPNTRMFRSLGWTCPCRPLSETASVGR